MSEIDYLELDGYALRLFLAVLEEGSVTAAATRLGITQSAVSHHVRKLKRVLNDPLFVKSGRGIVATAHALALRERAMALLDTMKEFAQGAVFEPEKARLSLLIAANDFQRDLLLPALFRKLDATTQAVTLRIIPSDLPTTEMLREGRCDLLISPFPPTGSDILQKRLLVDRYVTLYDPRQRGPARTRKDYEAARHITVVYPDNERLGFDKRLAEAGVRRQIAVSVPNFAGVAAFLRGTDMLATLPRLYVDPLLHEFASAPLPGFAGTPKAISELPMYMAWHRRVQRDPAHVWLRGLMLETAREALNGAKQDGR